MKQKTSPGRIQSAAWYPPNIPTRICSRYRNFFPPLYRPTKSHTTILRGSFKFPIPISLPRKVQLPCQCGKTGLEYTNCCHEGADSVNLVYSMVYIVYEKQRSGAEKNQVTCNYMIRGKTPKQHIISFPVRRSAFNLKKAPYLLNIINYR